MRRLAAFALAVAASATLPALADAYTFTAGTAIPLKDNDAQASWVTTNKQVGEYNLEGDRYGAATLTLTLNNATAGNYVLVFQGCNNSMEATLTLSATDNSSYSRSATITQPKSSSWSDFTEHMFLLDDLPVGDFTLSFKAKPISGDSWNGGYKDFTFYKLDDSPYSLTGTPYDIVSNPGTALSLADGQTNGRLTLTGTEIEIDGSDIIGSTHSENTMLFWLNCSSAAKFSFKYSASNSSGGTPTVNWSLIGNGGNLSFSDTISGTGNWNTFDSYEHDLGTLSAGKYLLKATIASSEYWAGNYTDFTFTTGGTKNITAADGLTLDADEDWTYTIVTIEDGAVIDLHGFDLVAGSVTANTRGVLFTNSLDSAESLSTLTVDAATVPKSIFGGNLKVVQTGTDEIDITGDTYGANTHSGGTELSTSNMKLRSSNQFGSGAISLTGSVSFNLTAGGYDYTNWSSDFNVTGEGNSIYLGGTSTPNNYSFVGGLTGNGAVKISSGWQASITMTGDLSAFEGTLNFSMLKNTAGRGLWLNPGATVQNPGLPNANVVMANPGSNSSYPQNRLFIQKSGDVEFGSLATEIDENNNDTYYSTVYAAVQGVNLKVGAKADATYTGRFAEHNSGTLSIEKVGADTTWTLTSTNHNFSGAFVVSAGKVVFNNADKVALGSGVTVGANGTIGGSGTISSPITFTSGAKVEVASDAANTLTFSSAIDASTLTVKLTGTLTQGTEYTILTAGSGSTGKATVVVDNPPEKGAWRTKWDGTTLMAYYVKPGFVITIADAKITLDNETGLTTWLTENDVDANSATEDDYLATQNDQGISPLAAYMLGYTTYSDSTDAPTMTASVSGDSFTLAYDLTGKTANSIDGIALEYGIATSSDNETWSEPVATTTTPPVTLAFTSAGLYNKLVASIVAN